MLSLIHLVAVASLGLTAGLLIGCIGVGGVIVVPVLVQAGYPVTTAISVAMAGYIATGVVGTWAFLRHGTLDMRLAWPVCVGAMPAAIGGALLAQRLPASILELIIGGVTGLSGLHAIMRRRTGPSDDTLPARPKTFWAGMGALSGFVSALTGTGGPAALIPLLLWLEVPVLTTVGLAQVIQLPIGVLATIGNALAGQVDLILGAALGIGLALGAHLGVEVAHRLDQQRLRVLVALMLLGVGVFLCLRVIVTAFGS